MKFILSFSMVLFCITLFSQGELMNIGESGGALYYGTYTEKSTSRFRPDERVHTLGLSLVGRRVYEGGFNISKFNDDLTFSPYIAGYINSDAAIHLKVAAAYNLIQDGENIPSFSGTLFIDTPKRNWLVPSVTLSASRERTIYGGGLDFRIGNEMNLIGGIFMFKSKDRDLSFGINVGVLFSNVVVIELKDI